MTYKTDLYDHFDRIKRKYLETKDVDYYFLYNGTDKSLNNPKEHNLNYYSDSYHPSGIPVMWDKFIAFISETIGKYDYVIKVNSSTFVNVDKVIEKIKQHNDKLQMSHSTCDYLDIAVRGKVVEKIKQYDEKEDLYMGYFSDEVQDLHAGTFISGACTVFSDTTLKKLLEVSKVFKHNPEARIREDDVLIGLSLIHVLKIPPTFLDRYNIADAPVDKKYKRFTVPPNEDIEEALTYSHIRIRNDFDRDLIDKGIWNIIEKKLQL
tara:strand:+ start:18 stop:809 length:792 start_codon:yes stop_codon:yes gene_type:complete